MWKLLTILVVVLLAAVAARAEEAHFGPCVIGRDSPCNGKQWGRREGRDYNFGVPARTVNFDQPAASPDKLSYDDFVDTRDHIPESEPPSYL
ncbi:hypothetical protein D8674_041095 [Pyrus ussuriensis x Pyrus communis]|uniref:Uncharacterized protein n=1 Tax=Pyrus ussuriensis x Pyrus communis TaxID=2448454 RepID=A0A5N5I242_9ROSA|nr:hypothetical protein D8674_041095 [Pyrus ussuriensis x Pyrus communis]